jgi:prevent-host-death family protein
MIINATDLKNNLGEYLRLSAREEILITGNGRMIAKLSGYAGADNPITEQEFLQEQAKTYEVWPRKASYQEFQELAANSDERYEYIEGEIYLLASPKTIHQKVLGEIYHTFYNWFQGKKCQPMLAPYDITLKRGQENINIVQPDLMVICDLEENLNEKDYYMGVPALVVEIISESTRSKDFIKKLDLYMSTGIREYWIINPLNRELSIYLFEENNISKNATYKNIETAGSYIFTGLEVSLAQIFE